MTLRAILWIILLSFTPTLELRASIPWAILGEGWSPLAAGVAGTLANLALAPLIWLFLDRVMHLFLRIGWLKRTYERVAERKAQKLKPLVDRWGVLGLAVFIGVPLPGTGVYSGCLAAWVLKFRFRDYLVASALGCVIAGVAVTLVVASGSEAFHFFYKDMGG